MKNYFLCKAKYQKIDGNGRHVTVTEHYLVDAVTFIEAETKVNEELEPYITGEFAVTEAKISNISEIVQDDEKEHYYKTKVEFTVLDERSGKEKSKNNYILIQADNVKEAYEILTVLLSDTASNCEILSIDKTPILDILKNEIDES